MAMRRLAVLLIFGVMLSAPVFGAWGEAANVE